MPPTLSATRPSWNPPDQRRGWGSNPQGLRSAVFETAAVAVRRLASPGGAPHGESNPDLLAVERQGEIGAEGAGVEPARRLSLTRLANALPCRRRPLHGGSRISGHGTSHGASVD